MSEYHDNLVCPQCNRRTPHIIWGSGKNVMCDVCGLCYERKVKMKWEKAKKI